jgi:hypothetical protein
MLSQAKRLASLSKFKNSIVIPVTKTHVGVLFEPESLWYINAISHPLSEGTSLDWKSQCLENPSVPLLRLADKKSRIYRV